MSRKNITPPDYIISGTSNSLDTAIIKKIYSADHITLQNNTIFALGIVTGNNEKHLLTEKPKNAEAIFRGKDMEKYMLLSPEYFIEFQPKLYQQTAPAEYYRRKKIAYRFICDSLICVFDTTNSLFLNSANLFISETYPMETITALFNSDIYTFIFKKKFHSKKVLKSHLQNLPLPVLSANTHKYINALYNKIINENNGRRADFQAEIDEIICKYFFIDKNHYNYIRGVL